jgi:O-antigen/teichoic acid export membrane protein
MQDTDRSGTFSGQVLVLFTSHIFAAGAGIVNGILLARLLGPAAKGEYTFLVLLPASAVVLSQLGLPQAFMYFSARGKTLGVVGKSIVLAAVLAVAGLGGVLGLILLVRDSLPEAIELPQVLIALIALPLALYVTFSTGIVMGRKGVRWYAAINTAYPFITTVLLVIVLGGFGASVNGALAVYLITISIQSVAFAIAARRVTTADRDRTKVSYGELFRYGVTYYPASLASFFSYRVDVYLIAFLAANASASIGYYSLAVGLAEMIFFFPTAVTTMFFPHVAGAPREESDRQVAMVSRVTLLITAMFALLLVPAAAVMITVLLPAFTPSFLPLLVLLPGVVALSAANVVGGFVTGIGRPGVHSSVNVASLVVNIVANLLLIPLFGIVGAAAASLLSYSLSAVLLTTIAAHLAGGSVADFWLVRSSDIRYTLATSATLVRRLRDSAARVGS